ncbi:MAG TPA: hypothetical protein VMM77_07145 [Gemmatimonadaceae bacterium]|nr:hypothetical protein [Gemmatimonadaceae bacterium]
MRRIAAATLALLASAPTLHGQGTLSTQGFGYPTGQLAARSRAMGGGLADLDPLSPLNPAAIGMLGRPGVYFEYAPEWRRVSSPAGADKSAVSRFPVVAANIAIGQRWMLGFASSTLLDRSWETSNDLIIGQPPDTATATTNFRVSGAMNDVRLAVAYRLHPTLLIGVGGHALTGESRTQRELIVPDSTQFIPALERRSFGYSGTGVSLGASWRPIPTFALGASLRTGGRVTASSGDTTLSTADYPSRAGASVEVTAIPGITLAARAGRVGWSNLETLSLTNVPVRDTWEAGLGLEGRGARVFGSDLPLRIGYSRRGLPFSLPSGSEVSENGLSAGLGVPLAGGRGMFDLTVQRLIREASGDVQERAWVVGIGVLLRL